MGTANRSGEQVVSCRVDAEITAHLDLLIDAGLHRTRSDAAAWLLRAGIRSRQQLLREIAPAAREIERARRQVREAALNR